MCSPKSLMSLCLYLDNFLYDFKFLMTCMGRLSKNSFRKFRILIVDGFKYFNRKCEWSFDLHRQVFRLFKQFFITSLKIFPKNRSWISSIFCRNSSFEKMPHKGVIIKIWSNQSFYKIFFLLFTKELLNPTNSIYFTPKHLTNRFLTVDVLNWLLLFKLYRTSDFYCTFFISFLSSISSDLFTIIPWNLLGFNFVLFSLNQLTAISLFLTSIFNECFNCLYYLRKICCHQ